MTSDDDDIVRAFLRRAVEGGLSREVAAQLDIEFRAMFGGDRHYVPRRPAEGKAHVLAGAVATGTSIEAAAVALGIHRVSAFRLLRRRWVTSY